jgi:hypothetical protein
VDEVLRPGFHEFAYSHGPDTFAYFSRYTFKTASCAIHS